MLSLLRHGLPFVLFLSLLVVGCDSGGSNDEANYLGTWERTDSNQYMNITEERMVVYARLTSDCYSTFTFEVIERNGENWQLNDPGEEEESIEVSVDGDTLTLVEDDGDVVEWVRSDTDPENDLDLC